jgi:hypothetical protein
LSDYRLVGSRRNQKSEIKNWKSLMYRRPKFLEVLHAIREEMSREVDYDVDLFAEMVRSGVRPTHGPERRIRGYKSRAPRDEEVTASVPKHEKSKRLRKIG